MNKTTEKRIQGFRHILYRPETFEPGEMIIRSEQFYREAQQRRSVRAFSEKPVPEEIMLNIIKTAGTAPSGANKQPWTFCLVSHPSIKKQIREAAEKEEKENYESRMKEEWLKDLKPLATDWKKRFLETAPWLIVVFKRVYETDNAGCKHNNYYVNESAGIACGMLLLAIHHAGLSALTHTPSPMNFLSKILNRPEKERPFLLIPVGYAAKSCYVPDIKRKKMEEICVVY